MLLRSAGNVLSVFEVGDWLSAVDVCNWLSAFEGWLLAFEVSE